MTAETKLKHKRLTSDEIKSKITEILFTTSWEGAVENCVCIRGEKVSLLF